MKIEHMNCSELQLNQGFQWNRMDKSYMRLCRKEKNLRWLVLTIIIIALVFKNLWSWSPSTLIEDFGTKTHTLRFFFRYSEPWKITSGEMYTIHQKGVFKILHFQNYFPFLLSVYSPPPLTNIIFFLLFKVSHSISPFDYDLYTQKPIFVNNPPFSSWFSSMGSFDTIIIYSSLCYPEK